jgi:hypothetical protein
MATESGGTLELKAVGHLSGCLVVIRVCPKYVKLHNNSKGVQVQHTQDTGTQCNTDEGNTGVIKKITRGVESFSSFENPCLFYRLLI